MSCCTYQCDGSKGCIAGQDQLVWPALDLPATTHCETIKQPCATPYTCKPACRLIMENSDGSDRDARPARSELLRADLGTVIGVIAAVAFLAAACKQFFGD